MNLCRFFIAITSLAIAIFFQSFAAADGPSDNDPRNVREIPPEGIEIDPAARQALLWRCKAIRTQWSSLKGEAVKLGDGVNAKHLEEIESEILVFPRAVEIALEFNQFYRTQDLAAASDLLDEATRRIAKVDGGAKWPEVVGFRSSNQPYTVIGGYKSKLDDSIQPYGLVIPPEYNNTGQQQRRLDIWFHGRGEKVSEIHFLTQQRKSTGQYTPPNSFVLHPYGRYCNAFKFAGEVDVFESLEHVKARVPVDPKLISVRGFSMGGAGCWQFATHYPDLWFAANPGAGFAETREFLNLFQNENVIESAPVHQQTLWNLYDCPPWSRNLKACPTIAYSGELDKQKQAADVMAKSLESHGVGLTHIIGPNTAHKIHADSKNEIERRMQSIERSPFSHSIPSKLDFTTYTLRYSKHHWLEILGLREHWKEARVQASLTNESLTVETHNVSELSFNFHSGQWIGPISEPIKVIIDGQTLSGPIPRSDLSWHWKLSREDNAWVPRGRNPERLMKKPGLQGPVDDAFMERFVFVLPSGQSDDKDLNQWVKEESTHAMTHWRKHFRGDIRQIRDDELTEDIVTNSNLILFGDHKSNSVIQKIADQLPVRWEAETIRIGNHSVPKAGHVPVLIHPNPLNRSRYIVLNSGFTFREYAYLNNARQTPKLPDWALIDITDQANSRDPGIVRYAGFFDEYWQPK